MKKIISIMLAVIMLTGVFTACSGKINKDNEKKNVVCTIFPVYDWMREIAGDTKSINFSMLLDGGVDMHSFQPSADDIIGISSCDLFVYVGGESDAWVSDALKEVTNKNQIAVNLMDSLGEKVKQERAIEGMEAEEGEEKEPESDEHIWLSLKNAEYIVPQLARKLGAIDKNNAAAYTENAKKYIEKLTALDKRYKEAVDTAKNKTLIVCDRFPFMYLADDYSLTYFAAFPGCSAETEASFETVAFLAKKVDELGLSNVLVIEGVTHKIAETVIKNTRKKEQSILSLDSMQSVTADGAKTENYLGIMEKNLGVLKTALN